MKTSLVTALLGALLASTGLAPAARGQVRPVPPPPGGPVAAQRLVADVRIVDGVATTRLVLTVRNDTPRQEEAIWLLPLPEGSVADQFRMRVGGVTLQGEVLDQGQARQVYESIVRSRRDPGLLEYVGRGCLRARVFPIPPQGSLDVEVVYREVLPFAGGLHRWAFPVAAAGLDGGAPREVVLDLAIQSRRTLHNAFSPTPGVHVVKQDDHHVKASFEGVGADLFERELAVLYGLSDREFGLDLLSTRARGEVEGTFLMLISPRRDLAASQRSRKSITFVLDTSGSMQGEKIEQARRALRFFLGSLDAGDAFNVVPFSTEPEPFFGAPVPADQAHIAEALRRVDELRALGGTNLDEALRASLEPLRPGGELVPMVVLLTDGLPTVQEQDPARILEHARAWNHASARLFAFGVGDDVNTFLLDSLAGECRGTRTYVRPGEDLEVKTSELFAQLSKPVLTDLALSVDGVQLTRVVPHELPDLFHGGRLMVFGRYRGEGPRAIRLTGKVAGEPREFVYEGTFADGPTSGLDFVPSLWAERRVAVLLDEIRLRGKDPELVDEVRRLGLEHHIVTPYTSHLIVEDGLRVARRFDGDGGVWRGPGDTQPVGNPGPATAGSAGPGAPSGGGPTLRVQARAAEPDLDAIAERLRAAGVLPEGAPREELRRVALDVAQELRQADAALRGLGQEESGARAVSDSAYLARLVRSGATQTGSDDFYLGRGEKSSARVDLVSLFTRKVKDKVFVLRAGVWTDRALPAEESAARVVVEAYSDAWFDLVAKHPRLAAYFAFSTRLVVELDGVVYEVRPEAVAAEGSERKL